MHFTYHARPIKVNNYRIVFQNNIYIFFFNPWMQIIREHVLGNILIADKVSWNTGKCNHKMRGVRIRHIPPPSNSTTVASRLRAKWDAALISAAGNTWDGLPSLCRRDVAPTWFLWFSVVSVVFYSSIRGRKVNFQLKKRKDSLEPLWLSGAHTLEPLRWSASARLNSF